MHQIISSPNRLSGELTPPGDRSISVRAVILNSISSGDAEIRNFGSGADCYAAIRVLKDLGAKISKIDDSDFLIQGDSFTEPHKVLNAGNSGTVMRLMAGLLSAQPFSTVITGDRSLRSRPMERVITPLRLMGAEISGRENNTLAPLSIQGRQLKGIEYGMNVASAQVKSAILIAALYGDSKTVINQPDLSRDHTERMLKDMGAKVEIDDLKISISPGKLTSRDVTIPADISSAAFWLVGAACHPDAEIRVNNVGVNPGRTGILDVLKSMGANIEVLNHREQSGEPVADLIARSSDLIGTEISGSMIPRVQDEIPILALAACFAKGTTEIKNAEELRVKETDRIHTIVTELKRLGAKIEETADGMLITQSAPLTGNNCISYGDHRIAMMLGIAGLLSKGETQIKGSEHASVTYPSFWNHISNLIDGKV